MPSRVVVISDGKRGHENQSLVLARMLGDDEPLVMSLRERYRNGGPAELLLRLRLLLRGPQAVGRSAAARLVQHWLKPESTDDFRSFAQQVKEERAGLALFTVSSGTPPATLNLVVARMLGARSIVNMTPSLLPRRYFDLCVVPAHDVRGQRDLSRNVVVTPLALGYHNETAAAHLATQLRRECGLESGQTYWGVALGGPSKACPWAGDQILDELAALHGLARGENARLLVTTSRRTPDWCLQWLTEHYADSELVAYLLDASRDPLNPLPAFYELADRMFVTGDSFSMVSEAVHGGHRPVVLRVCAGLPPGKLGYALQLLTEDGLVGLGDGSTGLPERVGGAAAGRGDANRQYRALRSRIRGVLGLGEAGADD